MYKNYYICKTEKYKIMMVFKYVLQLYAKHTNYKRS